MPDLRTSDYRKYNSADPLMRLGIYCFLRTMLRLISELSPGNILDAGCGEGFTMRRYMWAKYNHITAITGVDINYGVLSASKTMNPRQDFIQASIERMPFRDRSFDLVMCLEVLEHLASVDKALAELKRLCRKGCIISVPYEPYFSICRMLRGKDILRLGRHPEHISYFKINWIEKKLRNYFNLKKTIISFPWVILLGTVS